MKHQTRPIVYIILASVLFASCQPRKGVNKNGTVAAKQVPISFEPAGSSPDFPGAQLAIANVSAIAAGKDSAKVTFTFDVKNYELKRQTADTGAKHCSNSAQGQHIHFIMDNKPYKALYEPNNEITLPVNSEHTLMAFLSRSYHESIKSKGAAVVYHFKIDEKGNLQKLEDPTKPMIFYSRPKGDYIGKDTANVMLDYYIWNCNLSDGGYTINAKVTRERYPDEKTTMGTSDWKPMFIKHLGTGKATITLTLQDKNNQVVDGPIERTIQLAADEPLKK